MLTSTGAICSKHLRLRLVVGWAQTHFAFYMTSVAGRGQLQESISLSLTYSSNSPWLSRWATPPLCWALWSFQVKNWLPSVSKLGRVTMCRLGIGFLQFPRRCLCYPYIFTIFVEKVYCSLVSVLFMEHKLGIRLYLNPFCFAILDSL